MKLHGDFKRGDPVIAEFDCHGAWTARVSSVEGGRAYLNRADAPECLMPGLLGEPSFLVSSDAVALYPDTPVVRALFRARAQERARAADAARIASAREAALREAFRDALRAGVRAEVVGEVREAVRAEVREAMAESSSVAR
jgi:hypothetical protein